MKKICRLVICLLIAMPLYASTESETTITGKWITFDDKTGEKRSIVSITENGGKMSGKIIQVFFRPGEDTKCVKCEGEKHNRDIVGLELFNGLTLDDNSWKGGAILDPENGKEYDCELWLEGDDLRVRGYLLMFYRTQTWQRCAAPVCQETE